MDLLARRQIRIDFRFRRHSGHGWTCRWAAPVANDPKQKRNQTNLCSFAFGRYLRIMSCAVLLDLDGTLIDSYPGILASCVAALRALGHEPDETLDIRRTIGPPLEDIMQVLLQSYGDDRVGEAVAAYRQHYGESGYLGSVPYPGIGKSLEEMKRIGLRILSRDIKKGEFRNPHSGPSEVCHILRWHLWLSAERRAGSQA